MHDQVQQFQTNNIHYTNHSKWYHNNIKKIVKNMFWCQGFSFNLSKTQLLPSLMHCNITTYVKSRWNWKRVILKISSEGTYRCLINQDWRQLLLSRNNNTISSWNYPENQKHQSNQKLFTTFPLIPTKSNTKIAYFHISIRDRLLKFHHLDSTNPRKAIE